MTAPTCRAKGPPIMSDRILVLYGSYRRDRMGFRLARWLTAQLTAKGCDAELIDAMEIATCLRLPLIRTAFFIVAHTGQVNIAPPPL